MLPDGLRERIGRLTVVVPAYNEQDNVRVAVEGVLGALDGHALPGEVVVVDDGSTDGTPRVLSALTDARVRVVRHGSNRGYGAALASGFAAARGDHVAFMDSDRQFDPAELVRLLPPLLTHDMVVGYRAPRRDPPLRRVYGTAWTRLVNWAVDVDVRDVNCAFKVFPVALVRAPLRSAGAGINGELLARARHMGLRIAEVAVSHHPRVAGRASGARPRVVLRAVRELLALRADHRGR